MTKKKRLISAFTYKSYLLGLVWICALAIAAFGTAACRRGPVKLSAATSTVQDDREALKAQTDRLNKVEVTIQATVAELLPDDTTGIPHQRFLIVLSNGSKILVAHDTKMAPAVPLKKGDPVRIRGEYIWNAEGGVLHWTHHTDTPRHDCGWIEYGAYRYE